MLPMLETGHPFIQKCKILLSSFSHILDHANYRLTKNNQSDLVDRFQSLPPYSFSHSNCQLCNKDLIRNTAVY